MTLVIKINILKNGKHIQFYCWISKTFTFFVHIWQRKGFLTLNCIWCKSAMLKNVLFTWLIVSANKTEAFFCLCKWILSSICFKSVGMNCIRNLKGRKLLKTWHNYFIIFSWMTLERICLSKIVGGSTQKRRIDELETISHKTSSSLEEGADHNSWSEKIIEFWSWRISIKINLPPTV